MSLSNEDKTTLSGANADLGRVGPYRLVRQLGRGGMGTVYLGIRADDVFRKLVAIKVLKRGMDSEAIIRRFQHERQILAGLNHPNIAGLLDGGTTPKGLPYFAMEYVEGRPIVDYCESEKLDTSARLELFRKVCAAVQHAHQNLVIHRDIKPANVLVTRDGTPKLLDFGIAKLLHLEGDPAAPAHTMAGMQLMTPEYASPEQVRGDAVTTATDVYSLGVLLYELLTGRRPYRLTSRAPADIARVVCESVPERPSTAVTNALNRSDYDEVATGDDLNETPTRVMHTVRPESVQVDRLRKRLAGDLDNIVLKALSKEPSRRYVSVEQFAEDARRHLVGLPVIARKETVGYRTAKFIGRNKLAVASAVAVFAALIAGIIGTAWQARVARAERIRAEGRFNDVRQLANSLLFELHDQIGELAGSTPARKLLVTRALEYLDKLARDAGDRADLRRELAAAYVRVGDVQGRPLTANLGDTVGAMASYRKAVALYDSLTADERRSSSTADARQLVRDQAIAHMRVSELQSVMGDTRGALTTARKGLALQERVRAGASADARRELAASHSRVGDLSSATGDLNASIEHRRKALALMEALAVEAPNDVATLRQLGIAHQKLGNVLGNPNAPNVGDYRASLAEFDRAAAVFRHASAAAPTNAQIRRNGAVVDSNTSDVLVALKRPADALARMQQAFETFRALSTADPANAAARNDFAIAQSKMGELLDGEGRSVEALREYEQALAVHESLARADPANDALRAELASGNNRVATVQAKLGDRSGSLAHHARAIAISRELAAANPGDVELGVALALALNGRGDAFAAFARRGLPHGSRSSDLASAMRDYTEGVALLEKLHARGAIAGSDLETLNAAKVELAKLSTESGAPHESH